MQDNDHCEKTALITTSTVMSCRLAISIQGRDLGLALNSAMETIAQGSVGMSQKVQRILEIIRQENIAGNVIKHCSGSLKLCIAWVPLRWRGTRQSTHRVTRAESPNQLHHRGAEQGVRLLSFSLCSKLQASHKTAPKYFETNGRQYFFLAQDISEVQNSFRGCHIQPL